MNRILVPTDFTNIAENAFKIALKLARKTDAEVYLLNIIEPILDLGFSASGSAVSDTFIAEEDRFIYELHKTNEKRLMQMVDKCAETGDLVFPIINIDKVGDGIVGYSNKINADLIVMGTSGENTLEELLPGNHTEQVMRETHCPVLAVRNASDNFDVENVVIATDFTSNADHGMEHMKNILKYLKPQIHLLHISKSAVSVEETNKKLNAFAGKYNLENFTINVIKNSSMKAGIEKFASEVNADLIVAFTHGRTGLSSLFKKNYTEELIRHNAVPVISIHFD